ncbi:hypothetical protein [Streptomyces avicenniae]|uniref:hypothetical protein n=1 Tax=Streptomyces avicenniae TaxID=500153 RepID=UPI000AB763B1|nr:hypothetical protein [Streptomyces avicenniae]
MTVQQVNDAVHQDLTDHGNAPQQHLVDAGHVNARKNVAAINLTRLDVWIT